MAEKLLRPRALDESSKLAADVAYDAEEIIVDLANLAAETFDHADYFVRHFDGKAKGCAQTLLNGGRRAREISAFSNVRDPGRVAALPYSARQADSRRKPPFPAFGFKMSRFCGGHMPELYTGQFVRRWIDAPYGAGGPLGALA